MRWLTSFWSKREKHVRDPIIRWYDAECERLVESARFYRFKAAIWSEAMLKETSLYRENKEIFDLPYFGWLFKPAVTMFVMSKLEFGDVLLYSDSNHTLARDPLDILALAEVYGLWCHRHTVGFDYPNREWTKRDAFVLMGCDDETYWNEPQTQVNFFALCKTQRTMRFVADWTRYCCDARIETDCPNVCGEPDLPEFREHRWEQSVFSLLRQQYGFPIFPEPSGLYTESMMGEKWAGS